MCSWLQSIIIAIHFTFNNYELIKIVELSLWWSELRAIITTGSWKTFAYTDGIIAGAWNKHNQRSVLLQTNKETIGCIPLFEQSIWHKFPFFPWPFDSVVLSCTRPLHWVSSIIVNGSSPEGHLRREQSAPNHSDNWDCPAPNPTSHRDSHTHPNTIHN